MADYTDDELYAIAGIDPNQSQPEYTDAELMSIAGIEQPQGKKVPWGAAFAKGVEQGVNPFSDEYRAIGSGLASMMRGDTYSEGYEQGLSRLRGEIEAGKTRPYAYGSGEIVGMIGVPTIATPTKVAQGIGQYAARGLPQTIATTTGAGALSGGLYGAGASQKPIGERGEETLGGAGIGAGFGAIGAVAVPLATKAARAFGFTKPAKKVAEKYIDVVSPEQALTMQRGEVLDLTKGQLTQDATTQALEKAAIKGGLGSGIDSAQDMALKAQEAQQGQLRNIVGKMAAGGDEALEQAAKSVKQAQKSLASRVSKAYDDARVLQNTYISQSAIDETFKPQIKAMLREGGFALEDFTPRAQKIINQVQNKTFYPNANVTAQNLEKMEFWRRRATNAASDAFSKGDKAEGKALSEAVKLYDQFMEKLPDDLILSGNDEAINKIKNARYLRKMQGVLFERNKAVKNLIENSDLTNEELANMVLTGSKASEKIGKGAGSVVRGMKRTIPEEALPEFTDNLKRGTMARVLKKSEGSTLVSGQNIIEPHKLEKELSSILDNKTFSKEVFSDDDIKLLTALKNDLSKINSVQAGADNYSNTAYTIMRFFEGVPWFGALPSSAARQVGDVKSKKAAQEAFSPLYGDMISELTGKHRFYGSAIGGAQAGRE